MTKQLKKILSVILVAVFITPLVIKFLDSRLHHYDRIVYNTEKENHFHEYHKKCPIPGFEFSLYELHKNSVDSKKYFYQQKFTINYITAYFHDQSKYSFLLRAPPVFL